MGRTVLHLAAENNNLEKLEELLKSGDYDVNEQDVHGRSSSLGNLINTSIYAINQCHNLYSVILY
jgi:ankyrin repeat protein